MARPPSYPPKECPHCGEMVQRLLEHVNSQHGGYHYSGYEMRSSWEVHTAKHLDALGLRWEYELVKFRLSDNRVYLPDFHVFPVDDYDYFIEVKGRWMAGARRKFMQFRDEYPHIIVELWTGSVLRRKGILPGLREQNRVHAARQALR